MCTSGYTTQQKCRQHVYDEDLTILVGYDGANLRVYPVTAVIPDDHCNLGPTYGDSGGAVYQGISGRPGYVRAMGIITAIDDVNDCGAFFTRLSGVRIWGPTATVPVR